MAYSLWPIPTVLYAENIATATVTTSGDLWGSGTTKSGRGQGLYLFAFHLILAHNTVNAQAQFQLQKSTDGTVWTNVDPAGAAQSWVFKHEIKNEKYSFDPLLYYSKTGETIEYLKLRWATDLGTLTNHGTIDGANNLGSFVRVIKFPT